jgi:hypothetical protein
MRISDSYIQERKVREPRVNIFISCCSLVLVTRRDKDLSHLIAKRRIAQGTEALRGTQSSTLTCLAHVGYVPWGKVTQRPSRRI